MNKRRLGVMPYSRTTQHPAGPSANSLTPPLSWLLGKWGTKRLEEPVLGYFELKKGGVAPFFAGARDFYLR